MKKFPLATTRPAFDSMHGLMLAAGEAPNAEAAKAIRTGAETIATCIASMLDYLEEPLKSKFLEVKTQINTMLAGLPATDAVPAAMESNCVLQHLLSVMGYAQSMMTNLTEAAKQAGVKAKTALSSLPDELTKLIDAEVAKGALIKKADHDMAVNTAVTNARKAFTAELATAATRRTALTTASLPIPPDELLVGEDKDYTPRVERAKKRADELKVFKISGERLMTLCWKVDDTQYAESIALAKEVSTPGKAGNGFVVNNGVPGKPKAATAGCI